MSSQLHIKLYFMYTILLFNAHPFLSRLWELQQASIEQHVVELMRMESMNSTRSNEITNTKSPSDPSDIQSDVEVNLEVEPEELEEQKSNTRSVEPTVTKFKSICGTPIGNDNETVTGYGSGPNIAQLKDASSLSKHMGDPIVPMGVQKSDSIRSTGTPDVMIKKKRTMTVEEVIDSRNKNNEMARRILKLYKLNKKHTILFWCMILVNILWTVLLTSVSSWIWLCVIFNYLVNFVCIWLMFGISKRYWDFATKWGPCYLCYCSKKGEIGSKYLLCFC